MQRIGLYLYHIFYNHLWPPQCRFLVCFGLGTGLFFWGGVVVFLCLFGILLCFGFFLVKRVLQLGTLRKLGEDYFIVSVCLKRYHLHKISCIFAMGNHLCLLYGFVIYGKNTAYYCFL